MIEDRGGAVVVPLVGAFIAAVLVGCTVSLPAPTSPTTPKPSVAQPSGVLASPPTSSSGPAPTAPSDCPVTLGAPGPERLGTYLFGWASSYGTDGLWVGGLWPGGVIAADPRFVEADGSISMKFGWWRDIPGKLAITGRRLDASAPAAGSVVPDGYGASGFQASGVIFPTEGCWEITGTVGAASVTFVTFVSRVG
jgi:hypothetical protein